MDFLFGIAALLISMVFIQEVRYLKAVEIKTIKAKSEIALMLIATVAITAMILILAKNPAHYMVGFVGILFIPVDVLKQGISAKGILIVARGKQLYRWNEIDHADIVISKQIKIQYFSKSKSKIATQLYPFSMHDKIIAAFNDHALSFKMTNA